MSDIEITKFLKDGGPLTKKMHLAPDGTIANDSSRCRMPAGVACRVSLVGVHDLGELVDKLPAIAALALGALRPGLPDQVPIASKCALDKTSGAITRSKANIVYSARPGFVLLDHDTKGMPQAVADRLASLSGFAKAVASVLPALEAAGSVLRRSTSSGIYNVATGASYPGSNGAHLYVLAMDVSDAQRFLYALHDRLWPAGLGWLLPGKAGQELNRSVIDRSVFGPERLVFEADPELAPGLAQEPRIPLVHEGAPLDTRTVCPDLSPAEKEELKRLHAAEKERIAPECKAAREAFIGEQIEKAVARGLSPEAAPRP